MVSARACRSCPLAAHRGLDTGLCQPFGVPDADVLRPAVAVAYQTAIAFRLLAPMDK